MTDLISIGQASLNTRPHALYRFYDRSDVLLYVGITADLPKRIKDHRKEKPWWTQISTIKIEPHESRADVLEAESEAIRTEQPLYNSTHNTFIAPAPVSPKQAVADFAAEMMGRLDVIGEDADELIAEIVRPELEGIPYPFPKVASAALIAADLESHGKYTLMRSARNLVDQLDPDIRSEFEQESAAEAVKNEIDPDSLFYKPVVLADVVDKIAAMLAKQYLDGFGTAEAEEWIACATAAYPHADKHFLALKGAKFARMHKAESTIPLGMCMSRGQHGAGCPAMAEFDIQFICAERHTSGWQRYCARHADEVRAEGVTHQDCGTDATVAACEPTQAPDWGWAP